MLVAALAVGGWLWVREIGGDLANGIEDDHAAAPDDAAVALADVADAGVAGAQNTPQAQTGPAGAGVVAGENSPAAQNKPAGPGQALVPRPVLRQSAASREAEVDPVVRALLATSSDHVARGVRASRGSVPDLRALKGSSTDLIERALNRVDFPLRAAIIAHRARDPKRYGLKSRPVGEVDFARAVDVASLAAFLDGFTARLEGVADADLIGGDLVVVEDSRGRAHFAVVSDRTDAAGASLLYTLDPADGVARDDNRVDRYQVRQHWRLHARALLQARRTLGLAHASGAAAG